MRTMKMFTMALAAVTMFASCSKENEGVEAKDLQLLVKIATGKPDTKATAPSDPAEAKKVDITNGVILLCSPTGDVKDKIEIKPSEITGQGQSVGKVTADTKVYVVANVLATTLAKWDTDFGNQSLTLEDVNKTALPIYETNNEHAVHTKATLANSDAQSAAIIPVSGSSTATVDVTISPVYTRIELSKITSKVTTQGTDYVETFTVSGVYLDAFHGNYTVGAGGTAPRNMSQDISSAEQKMSITGTWASTTSSPYFAEPGNSKIWGFNLASVNTPKLVIALTNVTGKIGGVDFVSGSTYYLTVKTYKESGSDVAAFLRGNVYRIADLEFEAQHLADKPNNSDVDLTVKVTVAPWELKDITGGM